MSHELIHTSAPRGLKPNTQGFTTVAMTEGLPLAWRERLESLSAYEAPAQHLGPDIGPVAYSHVRTTVAGRTLSVVSRVGPCGLDYSGRPNRIAHHIVLEPTEHPSAGPAWLLAQAGLWRTEWTDEPRVFPHGPAIPSTDASPDICEYWLEVTGDAGWAGVLLEGVLTEPRKPVYLIYDLGVNVLRLLAEATNLLQPSDRWQLTFTTYYSSQHSAEVLCSCRCLPRGTKSARNAIRTPGSRVIDLASTGDEPSDNSYVYAARSGLMVERKEPQQAQQSRARRIVVPMAGTEREVAVSARESGESPYRVEGLVVPPAAATSTRRTGGSAGVSRMQRGTPSMALVIMIVLLIFGLLAAFIPAMIAMRQALRASARVTQLERLISSEHRSQMDDILTERDELLSEVRRLDAEVNSSREQSEGKLKDVEPQLRALEPTSVDAAAPAQAVDGVVTSPSPAVDAPATVAPAGVDRPLPKWGNVAVIGTGRLFSEARRVHELVNGDSFILPWNELTIDYRLVGEEGTNAVLEEPQVLSIKAWNRAHTENSLLALATLERAADGVRVVIDVKDEAELVRRRVVLQLVHRGEWLALDFATEALPVSEMRWDEGAYVATLTDERQDDRILLARPWKKAESGRRHYWVCSDERSQRVEVEHDRRAKTISVSSACHGDSAMAHNELQSAIDSAQETVEKGKEFGKDRPSEDDRTRQFDSLLKIAQDARTCREISSDLEERLEHTQTDDPVEGLDDLLNLAKDILKYIHEAMRSDLENSKLLPLIMYDQDGRFLREVVIRSNHGGVRRDGGEPQEPKGRPRRRPTRK